MPEAAVEDPDLAVQVVGPFSGVEEERLDGGGGADEVGVLDSRERAGAVAAVADVEREFEGGPRVEVFAVID